MEICALDLVWQSESTEDFAVRRAEHVGDDNFLLCRSTLILEHLSSHLQFFIVCTSFPFTKMLNSVMLFKEFFEKFAMSLFPCKIVSSQFRLHAKPRETPSFLRLERTISERWHPPWCSAEDGFWNASDEWHDRFTVKLTMQQMPAANTCKHSRIQCRACLL